VKISLRALRKVDEKKEGSMCISRTESGRPGGEELVNRKTRSIELSSGPKTRIIRDNPHVDRNRVISGSRYGSRGKITAGDYYISPLKLCRR